MGTAEVVAQFENVDKNAVSIFALLVLQLPILGQIFVSDPSKRPNLDSMRIFDNFGNVRCLSLKSDDLDMAFER
jgi:hypothetical protein